MSAATATVMQMMESLPEPVQERVLEHLHDYVEDLRDEMKWTESFARSQDKLVAAARKAREEIARRVEVIGPSAWQRQTRPVKRR